MKQELEDFYRQEKKKLANFIRKRLRDSSERSAEDIVQDVMLDLFERADVSAPIGNLAGYVYRMIRNRIIDIYRSPKRQVDIEDEGLEKILSGLHLDTYSEAERNAVREAVYAALATLPSAQQDVWIATEVDGMSFRELSALWDEPMGTLLARKKRANDRLQELLIEYR